MHLDDPARLISHEIIYAAIYAQPRAGLKAGMIAARRQHKPARGLRRTTLAGCSITPKSLRIIHRPEKTEGRLVPGHCGMRRDRGRRCDRASPPNDLIKGAFTRSAVGTVVERKTRCLVPGSSSVRQSIRGIDCSAERAAAPPTRR
jgi:IS30 family transposase